MVINKITPGKIQVFLVKLISLVFLLQALGTLSIFVPNSSGAVNPLSDCTGSQFSVDLKSNSVFYFDDGSPITSNYVQVLITNKTGADVTGYSAKIEYITSNNLSVAAYETATHAFLQTTAPYDTLASGAGINMYWYLTASGKDNGSSTFDISIFNSSNTGICKVTKTISKVASTIAANANKLTSVIYSSLPTANSNGSATFTATVKGQTGTIGAGPSGVKDVNLSPATASSFDATRFRLAGTSYRCGSGAETLNQLYIPNACSGNYTAVFTYQYISSSATNASASNTLSPIMQIASGSQMKHTSTPSFTIAAIGTAPSNQVTTNSATNIYSSSATLNGTNDYGTYTTLYFCYSSTNPGSAFANNCTNKITAVSDGNGGYTANLTGLTNNTTYYFEFTGENSGPTYTKGGVLSFLAKAIATTSAASSVEYTTATLNGTQSGIASADVDTTNTFFYYTTTNPGSGHINPSTSDSATVTSVSPFTSFTASLTGLTHSTTYYFELVVQDINSITYVGGVQNFTTKILYTVTFNGNSQTSGSPSPTSVTQATTGASVSLNAQGTLAKTNYDFSGWNTNISGTGTNYDTTTAYTPTQNITLYAKWIAQSGVNVVITFNPNSGILASGNATDTATVTTGGDGLSVKPGTNPTYSGYTFVGWNTDSSANTAASSPATANSDLTFYAIWSANKYSYNGNTGAGSGPSDQTYAGSTLTGATNTFTAPSGYTFDGWCTTQPTVGGTCGGTKYSEGDNLPTPTSSTVTLYAIWKTVTSGGGGGGAPAPVYVPHPPTITSISAPEVCAVSSQLVIKGTWLSGATAKVDSAAARVLASSYNEMTIELPSAPVGIKTITVTNVDGSATTTVKYSFADTPVYVNYVYPETFKDRAFSYVFKATDAAKYEISGVMPAGLTLNPLTGELSGAPTQTGDYVFQIIASNICASTPLIVYMFVDKAIPAAFTCSVAFNVPSSNNITDGKIAQLKNCLSKMNTLSPKYIQPVVFLSGGVPAWLTPDEALTHPRYLPIIAAIQSVNADAQIYLGAFSGALDSVQVNVYWPEPSE